MYTQIVGKALSNFKEVEDITLRLAVKKDGPVITESGNLLLDVSFNTFYPDFEKKLKAITGVVETGLFMGYPIELLKNHK